MTRFAGLFLFTVALTAASLAAADDPIKGKPDAGAKDVKKDAPDADADKAKKAAVEDEETKKTKELVGRIVKGMDKSTTRLAEKDPRDVTQQIQRDVVKDLDELIEKMKKQQEQNPSGGGG